MDLTHFDKTLPRALRLGVLALMLASLACGQNTEPTPGGPCQAQRDCVTGETCVAGTCRPLTDAARPCTSGTCAPGEFCDLADGQCKAVLSSLIDAGLTTESDAGNVADASGADVDSGAMAPECQDDVDCSPPQRVCDDGACVAGCVAMPSRCAANEVCDTNTGRCVPVSVRCEDDRDCQPPSTICESNQCVPGCGRPGGVQCTGLDGPCDPTTGRCAGAQVCMDDADCMDPNRICVDERCALRCNLGRPCAAGDVCNPADGRCGPGNIALGAPCRFSAQCTTDICLGVSTGGTSVQVCAQPCSATSQCPLDFTCGEASEMGFCVSETLTNNNFDTRSGGPCSESMNSCQSGWCATAIEQCVEACSRDADCAGFGGQCWTYRFTRTGQPAYAALCQVARGSSGGTPCDTDIACRSNICRAGACADLCCSDNDCGNGQNCVPYALDASSLTKVCAPHSPSAGTGALGTACTSDNQCESELCVPVDINAPNGARQCSSPCCTHTDCIGLGGPARCRPTPGPITNTLVGVCFGS